MSTQTWPTMIGLMKSGTIRTEMSTPRPLNVFAIAMAIARPSRNSTTTLMVDSATVTQSE